MYVCMYVCMYYYYYYYYICIIIIVVVVGRDSSVGIATRYGLDRPEIESRWGARSSAPVQTEPGGPPCLLYNGCRVFSGGKAAGAWR